MEVSIRNFQCLEKVDLTLEEGLTVIVGPSNVGSLSSGLLSLQYIIGPLTVKLEQEQIKRLSR